MFILQPAPHSQEGLMHPRQALIQQHHEQAHVFRVSPASLAATLALPQAFWATALVYVLVVPKASAAVHQHHRTLSVRTRFPMRYVRPVLHASLVARSFASAPA